MENKKNVWQNIEFPTVLNVRPKLMADELVSYTPEETRELMRKMFEAFKEMTGYDLVVIGSDMPTRVLIPEENRRDK